VKDTRKPLVGNQGQADGLSLLAQYSESDED
jgi:hypothetical protein